MAVVLAEHSNENIDVLKVVKMLLIHDIVEIDAGDTFIYDTQKIIPIPMRKGWLQIVFLVCYLKAQAEELIEIWEEFEAGETKEAKFAKSMDRLEPLLQNTSNNGGTWAEFGVDYDKVYNKKKVIKDGSEVIWNYAENLINESVEKVFSKKYR
jgi:putative hydrolase of HD superfamily